MRTKEEVQKMLGQAVNATPFMPENNKEQRNRKDKMYCFIQVFNWVLDHNEELTKQLEIRIKNLREGKE